MINHIRLTDKQKRKEENKRNSRHEKLLKEGCVC